MRQYTLLVDRGPKPWCTGYSRDFRFEPAGSVQAARRSVAVKKIRKEFSEDIEDSAAWKIVCDGRA